MTSKYLAQWWCRIGVALYLAFALAMVYVGVAHADNCTPQNPAD